MSNKLKAANSVEASIIKDYKDSLEEKGVSHKQLLLRHEKALDDLMDKVDAHVKIINHINRVIHSG